MTIDNNIVNALAPILLGGIVTLQVWMVRQIYKLKGHVLLIFSHCKHCKAAEDDTDRIIRLPHEQ